MINTNSLEPKKIQSNIKSHAKINNIITIGSGKGGVGKSTSSVNLAISIQKMGYKVGILDADIYGPSIPKLMDIKSKPKIYKNKIQPIIHYNIPTISIGNFVDILEAISFRGPMASRALQQLLFDVNWPYLDILIIDLPPGTGDIQLTIAQKIPISGSIMVTTPQDISLIDVQRVLTMLKKLNIPILGIVENMSYYICPACKNHEFIFSQNGGEILAKKNNIKMLGKIPLYTDIRIQSDLGKPITLNNVFYQKIYNIIAENIIYQLSLQPKDYNKNIPNIIIEKNG